MLSWIGRGVVGLFLILRETYIPNLYTLLSLEALENVPGGGGLLESYFSIQLQLSLTQVEL